VNAADQRLHPAASGRFLRKRLRSDALHHYRATAEPETAVKALAELSTEEQMRRSRCLKLTGVMAIAASLGLAGCGGDPIVPGPDPVITPTPPTKANIVVTVTNTRWAMSAASGFRYAFGFDMAIRETAGVGANLNLIRADFYQGGNGTGRRLERHQIPGRSLNRLAANGSLRDSFVTRLNAGDSRSVVITVSFTDDHGNAVETTREYNCCDPWVGPLAR
jgi:hypothetical protein